MEAFNEKNQIPFVRDLEQSFMKNYRISMALLVLIIFIDLVIVAILVIRVPALYTLGLFAVLFSFISYNRDYFYLFRRKKTRLDKVRDEKIGNYYVPEIQKIVKSVLSKFREKEKPRIYLIDEPVGGPYVIDTYFLNFIGPLNAIYFPRHVFHFLKPMELKAILAHELGHFYRYMYPAQRFPYPFYLVASFIPFILIPYVHQLIFIAVLVGVNFGFNPVLNKLFNHKSKNMEYLSDIFAARLCGKLNSINALLVSCKYSELIESMQKKVLKIIRDDDSLSLTNFEEMYDQLIRILPEKPNSTEDVKTILAETISGFDFSDFNVNMSQKQISKEKQVIGAILGSPEFTKERAVVDWDIFDFVEKNHRIEEGEYAALISSIMDSDRYLVDSITDEESEYINDTHPSLRSRILFLHKNVEALNEPEESITI